MAAGLGFKNFVTGDILTAADANGYLQSQTVMVFADAAARTAAIASPQEGMISYLKDTNATQYYSGSAWVNVGGGSPLTTKGDLYTYSTADARLAVGTNGQVLTADSTAATGIKWATAGGATANYNLISTTTMSGSSSVTVSSIGGYDNYHIVILDVKWSGQNQANYRLNGDSGANYMNAMAQSTFPSSYASSQGAVESSSGATEVLISQNSQNSNSKWVSVIDIRGAASTTKHKMINHMGAADAASSFGQGHYSGGGVWKNTDALTSFTIYSYYAFTSGTIYVYGA